jgi:hypothetical protein
VLKIEKLVTASPEQWEIIIDGMRNPMNSWDKSDSTYGDDYSIGDNDQHLMESLAHAGPDHRKFMRMIPVYVTITAPLYWWKEFDTYKVGTVANSCSTMHKIHAKEFTLDDFSWESFVEKEDGEEYYSDIPMFIIDELNRLRELFLRTEKKQYWLRMIQLLSSAYNQRRTVFLNYEVLRNIYHARRNHKLTEWHTLCDFIATLPHAHLITGEVSHENTK